MDYKDLIEKLRNKCGCNCECLQTADVIETLLTERDAAVKDVHGDCRCCANNTGWHNIGRCATCLHETAPIPLPEFNRIDNFEWRGPQKESGSDGQA